MKNSFALSTNHYTRLNTLLQYSGFALILFGIKLWIIGTYGNATPFWDQWDAEAAALYKPFINHSLGWKDIFTNHNEHHIATTRLLALTILKINTSWNPLLQMVVNAGLHILTLIITVSLITRAAGQKYLPVLLLFALVLFAIPYGHENTLVSFQACFYFLILFSIVSIWLLVTHEPFSLKWWGGIGGALVAFFSLASGFLVPAVAASIGVLFYVLKIRRTRKQLIAIVFLLTLSALGAKLTLALTAGGPDSGTAHSLGDFYHAVTTILGWPIGDGTLATIVCIGPSLIYILTLIRKRVPANNPFWFLAALALWHFVQAMTIAYGRVIIVLSSRYLDIFSIGVLVNFTCLIILAKTHIEKRRALTIVSLFVWMVTLYSYGRRAGMELRDQLESKHTFSLAEEKNTRDYISTGDKSHLENKGQMDIPYPNPVRLAEIISWPEIRQILPGNINTIKPTSVTGTTGTFVPYGYFPGTPAPVDSAWGSYDSAGLANEATGTYYLRYDHNTHDYISFLVAGYPLQEGMKMETEQNGQLTPVYISDDPHESWQKVVAKVNPGPFSIKLTDSNKSYWMAITQPVAAGRLDLFTDHILSRYYIFVILGFSLLIIATGQGLLMSKQTTPQE